MSDDEFMSPAFVVDESEYDLNPNDIPMDGPSYLLKVRREAALLPQIVVADVRHLQEGFVSDQCVSEEAINVSPIMKLTLEDQLEHVKIFTEMRNKVALAKATRTIVESSEHNNQALPLGSSVCFGEDADIDGMKEGALPLLGTLMSMTQVQILQCLDDHIERLESFPILSYQKGAWLYALLVFTEIPLTPETCSSLRTLARTCARIRERLESVFDPQLPPVNLFICLVAQFFGQKDLADEV